MRWRIFITSEGWRLILWIALAAACIAGAILWRVPPDDFIQIFLVVLGKIVLGGAGLVFAYIALIEIIRMS